MKITPNELLQEINKIKDKISDPAYYVKERVYDSSFHQGDTGFTLLGELSLLLRGSGVASIEIYEMPVVNKGNRVIEVITKNLCFDINDFKLNIVNIKTDRFANVSLLQIKLAHIISAVYEDDFSIDMELLDMENYSKYDVNMAYYTIKV